MEKKGYNKELNSGKKTINKIVFILLIISIISIVLSFFFYLYVIPICLLGIVISILFRKKSRLFYLNIIMYLLCIIISIVFYLFFKEKPFNDLVGIWNCNYYNNNEYVVTINIDSKNNFLWSKYNDENNNYIDGTYELKKIDKSDDNKNVRYYNFVLTASKFVENGKEQDNGYNIKYDVAINIDEDKAIFINKENMIFQCNKISDENPIIRK